MKKSHPSRADLACDDELGNDTRPLKRPSLTFRYKGQRAPSQEMLVHRETIDHDAGETGDHHEAIDRVEGIIDRDIFTDSKIYEKEQEKIFARCWNFMCHETQIPNPGDYFVNYIGEESVIATRDKKGRLQVFLNSCRHRGNAVCRAEFGNTKSFLCTYHGWAYDLEGKLTGVPGFHDLYNRQLDRDAWGLIKAGKVQSYRGFVFATMDPDAPDLDSFLGPVGLLSLNLIANQGDLEIVDGIQKFRMPTNWKFVVDNAFDFYHPTTSHASARLSGLTKPGSSGSFTNTGHRVLLGEYGHGISGPATRSDHTHTFDVEKFLPAVAAKLQDRIPVIREPGGYANLFPNLWISPTTCQVALRLPRGVGQTEIWWFTFIDKKLSKEERDLRLLVAQHQFGPAGIVEQDDGENWISSTTACKGPIGRRYPLNYQMGLGQGKVTQPEEGPPYIDTNINEYGQIWTLQNWADWMNAGSWAELSANHAAVPIETR